LAAVHGSTSRRAADSGRNDPPTATRASRASGIRGRSPSVLRAVDRSWALTGPRGWSDGGRCSSTAGRDREGAAHAARRRSCARRGRPATPIACCPVTETSPCCTRRGLVWPPGQRGQAGGAAASTTAQPYWRARPGGPQIEDTALFWRLPGGNQRSPPMDEIRLAGPDEPWSESKARPSTRCWRRRAVPAGAGDLPAEEREKHWRRARSPAERYLEVAGVSPVDVGGQET